MSEIIEKARKGTEVTARGTAATARAVVPTVVIGLLIATGFVPIFVLGQGFAGDPESDMQVIAMALAWGLGTVATALAWGAAGLATAIHFAGRHLGRRPVGPDKTD